MVQQKFHDLSVGNLQIKIRIKHQFNKECAESDSNRATTNRQFAVSGLNQASIE